MRKCYFLPVFPFHALPLALHLPVFQPLQHLNPSCVAAWWGSSCLWPLYAKRGISHQLASTDTPAVWGRLMPTRDTLLFSPSLPLFSQSLSVSLSRSPSVFLPHQPVTQLIVCCVPPSSLSIALFLPPSFSCQSDRCGEVHDMGGVKASMCV